MKGTAITRWFVYVKPYGKNRYRSIACSDTKDKAIEEARKHDYSYVKGFDDYGKTSTAPIIVL